MDIELEDDEGASIDFSRCGDCIRVDAYGEVVVLNIEQARELMEWLDTVIMEACDA